MKKFAALVVAILTLSIFGSLAYAAEVPTLNGPYIVTTCGQSPGAVMLRMAALRSKIRNLKAENGLTADQLAASDAKTLIVTTGTSMKGMGAAGTDVDAEVARCTKLIAKAHELGIFVVGAHIEGMSRRADVSDMVSMKAVMQDSDLILCVDDSDSDGFITKFAEENNKPLVKVKDALAIGAIL